MSAPRVEEIVTGDHGHVPSNGVRRGSAREQGLPQLLQTPNFYPVGDNITAIRMCMQAFDYSLATVNNTSQIWRLQREVCIRYYYIVHDHIPDQNLIGHHIIGHRRHITKSFNDTKNWIAALLICKCAYGWSRQATSLDTLWAMGEIPHNRLVHNMLVKPLVHFLCTEMNPHGSLCYRKILKVDLSRLENNIKSKCRDFGAYSMNEALRRMQLDPLLHPNEIITFRDAAMCAGIEMKFLRIFSLIIPNFKWAFDQHTRAARRLWITDKEKATLYVGYGDGHVIPRYNVPNYP